MHIGNNAAGACKFFHVGVALLHPLHRIHVHQPLRCAVRHFLTTCAVKQHCYSRRGNNDCNVLSLARFSTTAKDDIARTDLKFQKSADDYLHSILDEVEAEDSNWKKVIDSVDLCDGVLEIILPREQGAIVINKHYIYKQLWYSAPFSGADYFDFSTDWRSQRTGLTLKEQLYCDLAKASKD